LKDYKAASRYEKLDWIMKVCTSEFKNELSEIIVGQLSEESFEQIFITICNLYGLAKDETDLNSKDKISVLNETNLTLSLVNK
tara:strand:- start:20 stop:268 length:249 start_codon:yes stop_codon:yes gene_type:complete